MKRGDLVKHRVHERLGVIIRVANNVETKYGTLNKLCDIAWVDGTKAYRIWDYELEKVNEAR